MDASSYDELFKEFQFDCKAIDEDDDNDETARTLLTEERQQRFLTEVKALSSKLISESSSASSSSSSSSSSVPTQPNTLVVQNKLNYKLESMSQAHIHKFAEQAMDSYTSTGFHWTEQQIRSYTTPEQRFEIANTFSV